MPKKKKPEPTGQDTPKEEAPEVSTPPKDDKSSDTPKESEPKDEDAGDTEDDKEPEDAGETEDEDGTGGDDGEDDAGDEKDGEEKDGEEKDGEEEDGEDGDGKGGGPTAEDLAGLGTSGVKGAELGAADKTIEMLLAMAERLPAHAVTYGVEMYAELTPLANLRNSPLRDSGFNSDYIDQIYDALLPVYNRAKFIFNCANYASSAQSSAGKAQLFVSPTGKSLSQIQSEMLAVMQKIVRIDSRLRADANAQIDPAEIPAMPDLEALPARLWSGSQEQLAPPLGFEFVPAELVERTLETYSHFAGLKAEAQNPEFLNLCLTYCKQVHQDVRATYVDVIGFIKDLTDGYKEINTSPDLREDVISELKDDLSRKKTALELRLKNRESEFNRIQEKARSVPKFRRLPDNSRGEPVFESGSQALEFFSGTAGLNYQLRGTVGDSGGLVAFWHFMEKSFEKFAKTVSLLPANAKLSDYFSFDTMRWELVRKSYEAAGSKWRELSASA